MSSSQSIPIILAVLTLSAGQILMKLAAMSVVWRPADFLASLLGIEVLIALLVYGLATLMWLYALKSTPLRIAYPFMALAFIFVPVLGHFLLGERMGINTFIGAILIAIGVWVSVWK